MAKIKQPELQGISAELVRVEHDDGKLLLCLLTDDSRPIDVRLTFLSPEDAELVAESAEQAREALARQDEA